MRPKPLWRWWLFSIGCWLWFRGPRPVARLGLWLIGWAPRGDWFGEVSVRAACEPGEEPF